MSIDTQLEKMLRKVEKPARYTGGEVNSVKKDPKQVSVRFGFAFPDTYEIGMSYMGMQILYNILNRNEKIYCERIFAPAEDMEALMREEGRKLFTLETFTPVDELDIVGFTLQYELSYTNVLNILDLSGIPLHSADRGEEFPVIVAGGPCAYNPEPLAPFFDLFYIGEGETVYFKLVDLYKECKKQGLSRKEFLYQASKIPGIYVPMFYDVTYNEDGTIADFTPNREGVPKQIEKQIVMDLSDATYPTAPIVPFIKATQDRVVLEIQRGCIRGCRFCQAGMLYRPTRERDVEMLKKMAIAMLESTGHEEISLSSLSSSDYSKLPELVNFLIDECRQRGVNISLPSLRIDAFSLDVMNKVQDVRKSSLTFAPEAGSQRLRDVINKGLTEEIIIKGAGEAFEGGWNKVKLYFMLGLPTETPEDQKEIAHLAEKIAERYYEIPKDQRNGKCQITVSTSFFVPKPFTPFQWARMCTIDEFLGSARTVNHEIKDQLNKKSIRYNWHEADVSVLEGLLARGDRKVAEVLKDVYEHGGIYDAWSETFDNQKWVDALERTGTDMNFYVHRERSLEEKLPWDFIQIGVTKKHLLKEWERAHQEEVTVNCRQKCAGCGAACYKGGVCFENQN